MITYETNDFSLVPIHLNICFFPYLNNREKCSFEEFFLSESFVEKLSSHILETNKPVVLDLKRIEKYETTRPFRTHFNFSQNIKERVFLVNGNNHMMGPICQEMRLDELKDEASTNISILHGNSGTTFLRDIKSNISSAKRSKLISILHDITVDSNSEEILGSTYVTTNRYVQVKRLFTNLEYYRIVLYELCDKIYEDFYDSNKKRYSFDFLLSSSTVGAAIATNLALILNIPVTHVHNLGPKLAVSRDQLDSLVENKSYLYVYDFLCLGTEYKLLKLLLNVNNSILRGAVGFSSYLNPVEQKLTGDFNAFSNLICVKDADVNLDYKVII